MQEQMTWPANLFSCDCCPECADSFMLPKLLGEMIRKDNRLFLIVGKHPVPDKAGAVIKKGKGWKVYRQK